MQFNQEIVKLQSRLIQLTPQPMQQNASTKQKKNQSFSRKNSDEEEKSCLKRRKTQHILDNSVGINLGEQKKSVSNQNKQIQLEIIKMQNKLISTMPQTDDQKILDQNLQANMILDKFRIPPLVPVKQSNLKKGSNSICGSTNQSPRRQSMLSGSFIMEPESLQNLKILEDSQKEQDRSFQNGELTSQEQVYRQRKEQRIHILSGKKRVKKSTAGTQDIDLIQYSNSKNYFNVDYLSFLCQAGQTLTFNDKNINRSLDRSPNSPANKNKIRTSLIVGDFTNECVSRNQFLNPISPSFEDQRQLSIRFNKLKKDKESPKPSQIAVLPSITSKSQTQRGVISVTQTNAKDQILNIIKIRKDEGVSRQYPQTEMITQNASSDENSQKRQLSSHLTFPLEKPIETVTQVVTQKRQGIRTPMLSAQIVTKLKGLSERSQEQQEEGEVVYSSIDASLSVHSQEDPSEIRQKPKENPKLLLELKETQIQKPETTKKNQEEKEVTAVEFGSDQLKEVKEIPLISKKQSYLEPLPILAHGKYYDLDNGAFRRRRVNGHVARKKSLPNEDIENKRELERKMKVEQQLKDLQDKLSKNADEITVSTDLQINLQRYSHYFKYKIYECFKPKTLKQTRNYIEFLMQEEIDISDDSNNSDNQLSPELSQYLEEKIETKLPGYINEKKLLQFDSNFESGNLDSVYLVNEREYNLMLKVDTNTRGNTYWFYFKVLNWLPESTVIFNILNIGRDISAFYSRGMQILTRMESSDGQIRSEWVAGQCTQVNEFTQSDIVRNYRKERKDGKEETQRYYNKLQFTVKFPEKKTFTRKKTSSQKNNSQQDLAGTFGGVLSSQLEQISERNESPGRESEHREIFFPEKQEQIEEEEVVDGSVLCFAYTLPYTYGDLLTDLDSARKYLLQQGGIQKMHPKAQEEESKRDQSERKSGQKNQENKLKTPRKIESSNSVVNDVERKKLTKNELAQREIKTKAINAVKDQLNRFETKLLSDQNYIKRIAQVNATKQRCIEITTDYLHYKQEVVSQSVGGLDVYQIQVTKKRSLCNCQNKKCIYITARLHAAETHGSFIMKYLIEELTKNAEKYDNVLSNYIVRLVPMCNPDGVTIGNARSSLVGLDLNRRWSDPNPTIHPEIYFIKAEMTAKANTEQGISIYCDLHGHNKKDNCFFYGCNKAVDEGMLSWTKTRLLPKIFAQIEEIFDYKNCRFKQDKYKLNTARVVVWNEMKVTNSFTLETSQFAKNITVYDAFGNESAVKSIQLLSSDLMKISQSFLYAVAHYHQLEKELEQEFKLHKGWFKPQKLKEITGEAARDKYARQLTLAKEQNATLRKQVTKKNSNINNQTNQRVNKLSSSKNVGMIEEANSAQPKKIHKINTSIQINEIQSSIVRKNTKFFDQDKKNDQADNEDDQIIGQKVTRVQESSFKSKRNTKQIRKPQISQIKVLQPTEITQSITGELKLVSKWSDLFNQEEIKLGLMHMKNKKADLKKLEELEEESSDSCPSVDNFNAKELQDCFSAVIDKEESNPFAPSLVSDSYSYESNLEQEEEQEEKEEQQEETEKKQIRISMEINVPNYQEVECYNQSFLQNQGLEDIQIDQYDEISEKSQESQQPLQINEVYQNMGRNVQVQTAIQYNRRPAVNRIGTLPAQIQEINRHRQTLAEQQNQTNLTSLILHSNAAKLKASAGPPSGIKSTNVNKVEQPLIIFNSFPKNDYNTPQTVQQNYRGPSIQQLIAQNFQNSIQVNQAPLNQRQTGQSHSPQMVCEGTAKFRFNIYNSMPPIQQQIVPNNRAKKIVKPIQVQQRNAQQSISQQPPQTSGQKGNETGKTNPTRKTSKQMKRQNITQGNSSQQIQNFDKVVKTHDQPFFQQNVQKVLDTPNQDYPQCIPQSAISGKQNNLINISFNEQQHNNYSQHTALRKMYANKYHSPNIKNFEGFDPSLPQVDWSPPVFQNKKLQEEIFNNSEKIKRKKNLNVSSMDSKAAQDLQPFLNALKNISVVSQQAIYQENQIATSQNVINRNKIDQKKTNENHFQTQQPTQLVGILQSNIISPRKQITTAVSPSGSEAVEHQNMIMRITHRRTTDKGQIVSTVQQLRNQLNETFDIANAKLNMNEKTIQNIYADDYFHEEQMLIQNLDQQNQQSEASFKIHKRGKRNDKASQRIQGNNITTSSYSAKKQPAKKTSKQSSIMNQTHQNFKDQYELECKKPLQTNQTQAIYQITPQKNHASKFIN